MMNTEIKVIDEFLADWKEKAVAHYLNALALQAEASAERTKRLAENKEALRKLLIKSNEYRELHAYCTAPSDDFKKARSGSELAIIDKLNYAQHPGSSGNLTDELNKILDREVKRKKATLIKRIEKKAGEIVDASCLSIGVNGELNGIVKGDLDTVHVQTIYAGGYNIQCLHYRVIVK